MSPVEQAADHAVVAHDTVPEAPPAPTARFADWPASHKVMLFGGILLLLAGLAIHLHARTKGINDVNWTYTLSRLLIDGVDGYAPRTLQAEFDRYGTYPGLNYMPYPPSTGVVFLPFSFGSVHLASLCWFMVLAAVSLGSVWAAIKTFAPRLHPAVTALVMGVVFCAACTRWGFASLQTAPVANGLVALFVWALIARKDGLALLFGALGLCVKVTNGLPFVVIALIRRQYALACGIVAICLLVNAAGFARLGGAAALKDYKGHVALTEAKSNITNYPDPHETGALVRLDWQYLLNGLYPNVQLHKKTSILLTILGLALVGWLAARRRWQLTDRAALGAFLGPVVCISLLAVYHHHYEASVLVAPVIAYAFGPDELRRLPGARTFLWAIVPYITLYFIGVETMVARRFGESAMLYPRILGPLLVVVALGASLTALAQFVRNRTAMADGVTVAA
jgi:hypothetical protein